jgi:hypothetical protein
MERGQYIMYDRRINRQSPLSIPVSPIRQGASGIPNQNCRNSRQNYNQQQSNFGFQQTKRNPPPPPPKKPPSPPPYTPLNNLSSPLTALFKGGLGGLFQKLSVEDLLLCAIILLLFKEEDPDIELIITLGIILLSGLTDN